MVECDLAKVEVAGSNPVSRSIHFRAPAETRFYEETFFSSGGGSFHLIDYSAWLWRRSLASVRQR
ncbi:MAG: hypothetical protein JWQ87_2369 [Candidatus Sulfotelmatobacter sp.]|nr:hypothetical protein [Candidatus Sulfotelmatobacter sp.]